MQRNRIAVAVMLGLAGVLLAGFAVAFARSEAAKPADGSVVTPPLVNWDMECGVGYTETTNALSETMLYPVGWKLAILTGTPLAYSARIFFERDADEANGGCETRNAHVERIHDQDSFFIQAQDLEIPPDPGKPFDVAIYQQISATVNAEYSASGWFLSLCGGSAVPSSCPEDYYMAKMIGIDPTGGVDPLAATVVWTENRNNFVSATGKRIGWANVRTSAVATAPTVTLFARISSPFRWHGNHGFIDALSIVRSPTVTLTVPPTVTASTTVTLSWQTDLGPDIPDIPSGLYEPLIELDARLAPTGTWRTLVDDFVGSGSTLFLSACSGATYEFRIRVRAEQPDGSRGATPNQRYPGSWSSPMPLAVVAEPITSTIIPSDSAPIFLPIVQTSGSCEP